VGTWAGAAAVAASSGAPLGGLLVTLSWRWIFLVNVPIGLFTVVLGLRVLPEIKGHVGARLPDPVSILSLLAAVTLLILGTVQGPEWGWTSAPVIGLLVAAVLSGALTVNRALTRPHAVIEAALFESREFATATVALFAFFVAFAIFLLITVLYLQDLWHYSALRTGLAIAPGPLASAAFAINAGRIVGRFGRARPAIAGASLTACSALFFLLLAPAHPDFLTGFLPGMLLGGAGAGLIQAPLFAAASTLPAHRSTTGSAVLNMARQVGSAVGVAALVAVLATEHPDRLSLFRRGWAVELTAAAVAAAVIALSRRGSRGSPAAR
jgi:MFS family permease